MEAKTHALSPYCLIGGTGRCGTTILARIFSGHPDVAVAPEWRFTIDPDGICDMYSSLKNAWTPLLFDAKKRRLQDCLDAISASGGRERFWALWKAGFRFLGIRRKVSPRYEGLHVNDAAPHFREIVDRLMNELSGGSFHGNWTGMAPLVIPKMVYGKPPIAELKGLFQAFLRELADDVRKKQGKSAFLEKNTWNILWYEHLLELVPEGKMVHIYRDPRDVVTSFSRQTWMPSDPVKAADVYAAIMDRWWEIRGKIPNESYLEIALEALTKDPEGVLKEICGFWGIPWDERLLATLLDRSHTGRWKRELDSSTQDQINKRLAAYVRQLGYE